MGNEKFIKIYADFLSRSSQLYQPLKVVFDCSNGTAGPVLKRIMNHELGIRDKKTKPIIHNSRFIILNSKPDGNFPAHGPDPSKKSAIFNLQSVIKRHRADLGVIFDADGDRVFFIDNRGRFVDPDAIARLLIWQLKPKKAIIDVRTGWQVRKRIMNNELGIRNKKINPIIHNSKFIIQSRVGHYFIKKLMRKAKADFGAERSGHYYFALHSLGEGGLYFDAGILAAIHVINAVSKLPYALADFVDLLPRYFRSGEISIKYQVSGIRNQELLKKIENKLKSKNYKLKTKNYLDGLTMEFKDWWFNLRPSNTEPVIRLNIEADRREILEKTKKELTKIIKSVILKLKI